MESRDAEQGYLPLNTQSLTARRIDCGERTPLDRALRALREADEAIATVEGRHTATGAAMTLHQQDADLLHRSETLKLLAAHRDEILTVLQMFRSKAAAQLFERRN